MTLREILEQMQQGSISLEDAERRLSGWGFAEVGLHRLDLHRQERTATPEVIFGLTKSVEQLVEIAREYTRLAMPLLMTKVDATKGGEVLAQVEGFAYDRRSRLLWRGAAKRPVIGSVAVVTAGSSDEQVAEECAGTLDFFGVSVTRIYDAGVAGIHRLFASGERIAASDVIIVVAGMEGALPSVVGGLFRQPMIAVPTSVGYGASFNGLSALLGMLNSCSPGITVVNIDNGFGAATAAASILQLVARKQNSERIPSSGSGGTGERT